MNIPVCNINLIFLLLFIRKKFFNYIQNDGNYSNNTGHARVYVYDQNNNEWTKKGNDIDGSDIGDLSSYSVDISKDGNLISIGSLEHDYLDVNNAGQVRIFDFDDSSNFQSQQHGRFAGNLMLFDDFR